MHFVMIGNTSYATLLAEYLEDVDVLVEAYASEEQFIKDKQIDGRPVIPLEGITQHFDKSDTNMIMGVGYSRLGNVRKKLYMQCKEKGYSFLNYIHPTVVMDKTVKIGEGNILFENVVIQKNTVIGNCNLFFSNSVIMHENSLGSFNTFGAGSVLNGLVEVGDCNFIGANATLRDHIAVSDYVLIGAGAYVNRNVEADTYILPARNFKGWGGRRNVRKPIKCKMSIRSAQKGRWLYV